MSRYLKESGHSVSILLNTPSRGGEGSDSGMLSELSKYADLLFTNLYFHQTRWPSHVKGNSYDFIYCCSFTSLLKGIWLVANGDIRGRLCAGVYHPREFCWQSKGKRYQQQLMKRILLTLPVENLFFINKSVARQTGDCLGRAFEGSPIIPISIDTKRFKLLKRRIDRRKIISIARITSFYTYNFHMVGVVKALKGKGYDLEFHVYGWGDEAARLTKYVFDMAMEKSVTLHGPLNYSELESVTHDAFAAIGMGTSLLEISACGVPALVAVDSNPEPSTYGFLHETTGYDIGGFDPFHKEFSLASKIEELCKMNREEYDAVARACQKRAEEFSMDTIMPRFITALENSKEFDFPMKPYVKMLDFLDLWMWRFLKLVGFQDPFHQRGMRKKMQTVAE